MSRSNSPEKRSPIALFLWFIGRLIVWPLCGLCWLWHSVSPVFGEHCRYAPTCSCYAREVLLRFGLLKGSALALRRVFRCSPRFPGGIDEAPSEEPCWSAVLSGSYQNDGDAAKSSLCGGRAE